MNDYVSLLRGAVFLIDKFADGLYNYYINRFLLSFRHTFE
jgi:hypothetical protein